MQVAETAEGSSAPSREMLCLKCSEVGVKGLFFVYSDKAYLFGSVGHSCAFSCVRSKQLMLLVLNTSRSWLGRAEKDPEEMGSSTKRLRLHTFRLEPNTRTTAKAHPQPDTRLQWNRCRSSAMGVCFSS